MTKWKRRLEHRREAERFYRDLKEQGHQVRVGMEASQQARRFEHLLGELQFELWIGDAVEIRSKAHSRKEDRSARCATTAAVADGKSISTDLDAKLGESRSTATALASSPMVQVGTPC
jgi:hypothetical protein